MQQASWHTSNVCLNQCISDSVEVQLQDAGEAYLVDQKFKEQFEIAHPTERYSELLDGLPAFFVGTEDRLVTLVELLCSEMSAAFQTTGIFLPKWPLPHWVAPGPERFMTFPMTASMLSVCQCRDVQVEVLSTGMISLLFI